MTEEVTIEKADSSNDMAKEGLARYLERRCRESVSKAKIKQGWESVAKGTDCLYPTCPKKATTAAFHGYPLCQEHFVLTQWISFLIGEKIHNENELGTFCSQFREAELWRSNI